VRPRNPIRGLTLPSKQLIERRCNLQNVTSLNRRGFDLLRKITEIMAGYWGDQYVLVQDKLVIVDQHSRRVVAIVSGIA
jgi:hypothetical protein